MVEEKPFSSISDVSMKKNIEVMKDAEAIILANIPFGYGNLKNLTCLSERTPNQRLIYLETDSIGDRDFTGGKATQDYNKFRKDATVFNTLEDLKGFL